MAVAFHHVEKTYGWLYDQFNVWSLPGKQVRHATSIVWKPRDENCSLCRRGTVPPKLIDSCLRTDDPEFSGDAKEIERLLVARVPKSFITRFNTNSSPEFHAAL